MSDPSLIDVCDMMKSTKIQENITLETLVSNMTQKGEHWKLWNYDEAPNCVLLDKSCAGFNKSCVWGEIVIELYWKNGYASDIIDILSRKKHNAHWWSRYLHKKIIINNKPTGELLMLFA